MRVKIFIILLIILAAFSSADYFSANAETTSRGNSSGLTDNIDDIINELDLSELEKYLSTLTEQQRAFLNGNSAKEFLKTIISGNAVNFSTIISFIFSILGASAKSFLPLMLALIAIAIAYNVINSIKGKFASESVESIIRFACLAVILILLISQVFSIITATVAMIEGLRNQTNIFFPIILTLMTAIGAGSSVAVYRPAILIFTSGIINLITAIAIPLFIVSMVFTAVGNISNGIKLKEMSSFFSTVSKWVLNTTFFLFMAFLSVQGITASVYDGISIRTTKFALSKYVPVIGGYLSEGFNLILAGSVLIKNSVGLTAVLLLLFTVIPYIIQIALLGLTLRLSAAIIEPLGSSEISGVVSGFGKNINLLISMVLGVSFLYFIFIMLVIVTGNLSL